MALSIGEIARRSGVPPSAIRYYEQIGLLPEPQRVNGRRRYGKAVLWRIALIQQSKQAGLTLQEIRQVLTGFPDDTSPGERWRAVAGRKLTEIDRQMAELERARTRLSHALECRCSTLAECAIEQS